MAELTGENQIPGEVPVPMDFGAFLKTMRESKGVTLEEIRDRTKIRLSYLEALEKADLKNLPAPIFTKGFIRGFCRYLGIDGEPVVAAYDQVLGPGGHDAPLDFSVLKPRSGSRFRHAIRRVLNG